MTVNRLIRVTKTQTTAINEALQQILDISLKGNQEYSDYQDKMKESQLNNLHEMAKTNQMIEEINRKIQSEIELKKKSEQQMMDMDKTASEISHNLELTNRQMIAHYQEALDFLDNFKSMMDLFTTFSNNIQETFELFRAIMKEIGIDITAEIFVLLAINLGYFAFGMIFIIFLNLRSTYKNILIGLSIFNASVIFYKSKDISIAGK